MINIDEFFEEFDVNFEEAMNNLYETEDYLASASNWATFYEAQDEDEETDRQILEKKADEALKAVQEAIKTLNRIKKDNAVRGS